MKNKRNQFREERPFFTGFAVIAPVICFVLCLAALIVMCTVEERIRNTEPTRAAVDTASQIKLPVFEEEVALCSDVIIRLLDGEMTMEEASHSDTPYRPFVFEYQIGKNPGVFELSETMDFARSEFYELDPFKTVLRIDNLKTGTRYYYRVTVEGDRYSGTFQTTSTPRFVSIPGAVNTRDIGGGITLDGLTVRQGLLIRGTEIDGLVNEKRVLPAEQAEDVREEFGFVYDFDLRQHTLADETYRSPLGVDHQFYTAPEYEAVFDDYWRDGIHRIFTDLADPEKYPMYLHCTWGKDRTGTFVFLLQGILNMSEEDMLREYQLSAFTNPETLEDNFIQVLIDGLQVYEGETIQEKIRTFLITDIGVTEAEIESIRNIFLIQ